MLANGRAHGAVAKLVRQRTANPSFSGSNPDGASDEKAPLAGLFHLATAGARTVSTGQGALRTTRSATEPSTAWRTPL